MLSFAQKKTLVIGAMNFGRVKIIVTTESYIVVLRHFLSAKKSVLLLYFFFSSPKSIPYVSVERDRVNLRRVPSQLQNLDESTFREKLSKKFSHSYTFLTKNFQKLSR